MLRAIRSLLHGPLPERWASLPDANPAQRWPFALLIAALLLFGVRPGLLIDQIKPAAEQVLRHAVTQQAPTATPTHAGVAQTH